MSASGKRSDRRARRESPAALTRAVKGEALRLGFSLVGVTTPEPPPHLDVYEGWLEAGRHGEMGYLATERARHRRADPLQSLPECQSILVLGINYLPEHPHAADPEAPVKVAAYALGEDYHEVILDRLRLLVEFIEKRLKHKIPHRIYTDTGPLLERELAQRAGLGWIGKNTCLIHPEQGSYMLLAEVLLGVTLTIDSPMATDHCGSCTLCIEACPTDCILPDRTLDATRCISYLTIELKGAIPAGLRPLSGEWVFGCDICQQVCPWNLRFAETTGDPDFQPRQFLQAPTLQDFLSLEGDNYREALRGSPLKRAKRRGLVRNAAVVAGGKGDETAVPALGRLVLEDSEPLVRAHAAWALGRIGGEAARSALMEALVEEQDGSVQAEIEAAIAGGYP